MLLPNEFHRIPDISEFRMIICIERVQDLGRIDVFHYLFLRSYQEIEEINENQNPFSRRYEDHVVH